MPTDIQLKLVLAKMVPDTFNIDDEFIYWDGTDCLLEDTELLHLCWLVEETLTNNECDRYSTLISSTCAYEGHNSPAGWFFHRSWQQRTLALCKVKGIEVV